MKSLPHFTTLHKASKRLLEQAQAQQLLDRTVERFRKKSTRPIELAAVDSTGLDTSRASKYYVKRRKNCSKAEELVAYRTYPKLELVCDCSCHLIVCANATLGPMVDLNTFRRLLFGTLRRVSIATILADVGYDTESNHHFARDGSGIRSVIPPLHSRPSQKLPSGEHRRRMKKYRDFRYGQRWQVETVMNMIKRNLSSFVVSHSHAARSKETMLKVLTHNIMLIVGVLIQLFYTAGDVPFSALGGAEKCQ